VTVIVPTSKLLRLALVLMSITRNSSNSMARCRIRRGVTARHRYKAQRRSAALAIPTRSIYRSTSYVERQNLTMRMSMRRFTRLTNGHSKKAENHAHMVSLHFMHYNFCRIHSSLRVTPAMAAGVTARLWSVEDIVDLLDAAEGEPKKRGPYKPRVECGGSITPLRGYPRPALRALPSLRRLWRRVLRDTPVRHYARPMICMTIKGAVHHVTRSCDLSCRTSSAAHSRASGIFPASLKARAFAKAWLSADRSAADSFPDRAPRALRVAADTVRIATGPTRFRRAINL
jgi:hypothetical protein